MFRCFGKITITKVNNKLIRIQRNCGESRDDLKQVLLREDGIDDQPIVHTRGRQKE